MRGYDNKALFRTPVSFNQRPLTPCPICNEPGLSCDKLGCWTILSDKKAIAAVIKSYSCDDSLMGMGILDNSQRKPAYSLNVTLVVGAVISLFMLAGFGMVFMGWGR